MKESRRKIDGANPEWIDQAEEGHQECEAHGDPESRCAQVLP
jgi:hypothetical protein